MFNRFAAALFFAALLPAQNNWFRPAVLQEPAVAKALQSVDERSSAIVDEWVHLVEIPAPSGKEQARAQYIRTEMEKLGLTGPQGDRWRSPGGLRRPHRHGLAGVYPSRLSRCFAPSIAAAVRTALATLFPQTGFPRNRTCRHGHPRGRCRSGAGALSAQHRAWDQVAAGPGCFTYDALDRSHPFAEYFSNIARHIAATQLSRRHGPKRKWARCQIFFKSSQAAAFGFVS